MKQRRVAVLAALVAAVGSASGSTLWAADEDSAVEVARGQAIVRVNGMVCSFCAYGAEKALSEVDGLDRSQFGDGVLIDTETRLITLALAPGRDLPIRDVCDRIVSAGYDPVAVHLRVSGVLSRSEDRLLLRSTSGVTYWLQRGDVADLAPGTSHDLQVHLDGASIKALSAGSVVAVSVDKRHSPKESV